MSASPRLVWASGNALAILCLTYAAVLAVGLLTLPSTDTPIQDPWFTSMEGLILAIAPTMVAFSVGMHSLAPAAHKPAALLSVIFMSMCASVTCLVHFSVLALSRQPEVATAEWAAVVFSFSWPSVVYAWDILAWDFFFALGALCMALGMPFARGQGHIRALLVGSSALAFFGLAGVPLDNMSIRNVGIIGYVVLFPLAALLLAASTTHADGQRAG